MLSSSERLRSWTADVAPRPSPASPCLRASPSDTRSLSFPPLQIPALSLPRAATLASATAQVRMTGAHVRAPVGGQSLASPRNPHRQRVRLARAERRDFSAVQSQRQAGSTARMGPAAGAASIGCSL
eukprot:362018-Chlamydomonas_euryale.AAC.3